MQYFLGLLLLIAILLEGTVTTVPLVLVILILHAVCIKKVEIFFIAFVAALLLDVFLIRGTGPTSIFYLCTLLLIFLYEKKYEIKSLFFVLLITGLSCTLYLFIFVKQDILLQTTISILLAGGLFSVFRLLFKNEGVAH